MDGTTVCFYFPSPNVVANATITFNKAFRCNRIKTSNQLLREVLGGSLFLCFLQSKQSRRFTEGSPRSFLEIENRFFCGEIGAYPFFFGLTEMAKLSFGNRFRPLERGQFKSIRSNQKQKKNTGPEKKISKKSKHIVKHEQPAAFV